MEQIEISKGQDLFDTSQLEFDVTGFSREKFQQQMHVQLDILVISKLITNRQKLVKKTIFELQTYINYLNDQKFFLLCEVKSQDIQVLDPSNDKQIDIAISKIRRFFNEIQCRFDILQNQETIKFFEFFPEDMKTNKKNPIYKQLPPFNIQYLPHNLEDLQVCNSYYSPTKDNIIACCLYNKTPLGKLGRVWSIIETDILETPQLKYKLLFQKCFDQRILSINYCKNHIFFGTHLGCIGFFEIIQSQNDLKIQEDVNIGRIVVGSDAIIDLHILDKQQKYMLAVTPQLIKAFEIQSHTIIAGGSLKQRLDGGQICGSTVNNSSGKIFFGTSKGDILIYQFVILQNECSLQFQEEIYVVQKESIERLIQRSSNLFIKLKKQTVVYRLKSQEVGSNLKTATFQINISNTNNTNQTMNCIEFIQQKNFFLAGYNTGMMCIWDSINGEIISAITVSNISEINFISYDYESDTILVGHDFGVVIFKFGDANKQLQEIQ